MEQHGDSGVTMNKSRVVKCDRLGTQALCRVRKILKRMEIISDQFIRLHEEEGENIVTMSSASALPGSGSEGGKEKAGTSSRDVAGDQAGGHSFEGPSEDSYSVEMQSMKDRVDRQGRIREDVLKCKAEFRDLLETVHKELVRTNNVETMLVLGSVTSLNIPISIVESLKMKKKATRESVCLEKDGKVLIEEVIPGESEQSSGCKDLTDGSVGGDDSATSSTIQISESLGWHLLRVMGWCDASSSSLSRHAYDDDADDATTEDRIVDTEDGTIKERLRILMPWTDVNEDDAVSKRRLMDIQRVLIACNHVDSLSQLVDSMLPRLLGDIHQVVTANVEFHRNQKHATRMESYRGPSASARAACAGQLVWTLQTCSLSNMYDDELEMIGKTVLDGSNDTSYIVRNICMAAAEMCTIMMPDEKLAKMHFLSKYIVPLVRASVEANDAQCWTQTYHAASAVLKRCPNLLSDIMPGVVEQLFRNHQRLEYAVSWVAAMKGCFVPIGIPLIEYSSTVLPILLEWIRSHDSNLQQEALKATSLYLRACWPRNKCHAHVIWSVLEQVFDRQGGADKIACDTDMKQRLKECCRVLWVTAGREFRNSKRESPTWLVTYVSQTYDA
eukprot:jgi/Picsp_1/2346/NSC_05809-R1_hypothetical protein CHLNCDRAFT_53413 [Chlorella variabilis]